MTTSYCFSICSARATVYVLETPMPGWHSCSFFSNREITVQEQAGLKRVSIYCNSKRCISPFIHALLILQNVPVPAVEECSPLRQFLLLTNITPLASWVLAVIFGTVFVRSRISALPAFLGHASSKVKWFVSPVLGLSCWDQQSEKSSSFRQLE